MQRRSDKSDSELFLLGRVKRTLSQALVQDGQFNDAIVAAEEAVQLGDPPAYSQLLRAVATARLGDTYTGRSLLQNALVNWPTELDHRPFIASVRDGILWIDSRSELQQLLEEANELIPP